MNLRDVHRRFLPCLFPVLLAACVSPGPGPVVVDTGRAQELWETAMSAYLGGRWDDAAVAFTRYRDEYPRSPLASEVSYWAGLARMAAGRTQEALPLLEEAVRASAGRIPEVERQEALDWARKLVRDDATSASGSQVLYVVQVGAFSSRENAETLMERLRGAGYAPERTEVLRGARTLHVVRVGPPAERRAAEALKDKLQAEQGLRDAIIMTP